MSDNTTRRHGALIVLIAGALILGLNMGLRQTFGLFLDPITRDLSVSHTTFSFAIAIQNLLWGALTPFFCAVADRWGTGRVVATGGVLYVAGLLTMALVQTPLGLNLGAGILVGMAVSASGFPLILSAVARSAPVASRGTWLGLATAGGSIGQFALLPASQALIGSWDWVTALLVLAVAAALVVPLALPLRGRPAPQDEHTQPLSQALREASGERSYWLLNGGFFVCGFHVAFIATHLPSYLTHQGLSPAVGATALALVGFFNIVGSFGAGWLGSRFAMKRVLAGIYLARALVILLMLSFPMTPVNAWLFGSALGLLWLGTVPLTSGLVSHIFGARYLATLFGIVMLSHQMGAFLGAWLGGLSFDLTGSYQVIWWLAVGLALMAAALHWPIEEKPLTRAAPPAPVQIR
ncbi:MFS transporter [Marinobacter caseinilyticus]|uniref:MFS transporter n=1 Tax=Marinobacter caseinilyticus TaxID=2692195 RepID=UPI001A947CB0|nr:MFS transporter [Marinobacter caseinilyticus]